MIEIQPAKKEDLIYCAKILREIYNNNVLGEGWTVESSNAICEFFFKLQPDLFLVAKNDRGGIVGFTFSFIKPWAKGNVLMAEELAVKEEYRKQKVASKLLKQLVETAQMKYNITCVNGTTYNGENEMPYSWYKRIGFKKVDDLFLIESNPNDIINKLSN